MLSAAAQVFGTPIKVNPANTIAPRPMIGRQDVPRAEEQPLDAQFVNALAAKDASVDLDRRWLIGFCRRVHGA
jgi:hypothetical protein